MKNFDIIIVGGGASGSVLACMLAKNGARICVFDKNENIAKKLLVTGNGKCNLTNKNLSSEFYNQNIDDFLKFGTEDTTQFFKTIGLETYFDQAGRCYPISNTAKSVVAVIENQFKKHKISFVGCAEVEKVTTQNGKYVIELNGETYCSKSIVFATNLCQNVKNILSGFGVSTSKENPSLVALKTIQSTKRLDGTRLENVCVKADCNGKTKTEFGEILFKKQGLSGICIFNLSTLFARLGSFAGKVTIDIFPRLSHSDIVGILVNNSKIFDNVFESLVTLMQKEVAREVLKRANLDENCCCDLLSENDFENLAKIIKHLSFDVCGTYDNNQVLSGGVDLKDLTNSLESKVQKNLYCCGELCNVDGECGGYNLQWAFASANAVAKDIVKKIK